MTRREMLAAALAAQARGAQPEPPRPNIVFILVDDLRWDELGCTGHPFAKTPNIDRIAKEGATFTNAFMTTPLCSPSRASFLTGQYAHTNGITDNTDRSPLSHKLITWPMLLHAAGYESAFIGKWHMGLDDSPRPGFDRWVSFPGQGTYFNPELNEDGKTARVEGYTTDLFTDRAVEFIGRERKRPFVLYLAHKALHPEVIQNADGSVTRTTTDEFRPAERHLKIYEGMKPPRRKNAFVPPTDKPALMRKIDDLPPLGKETATTDDTMLNRLRLLAAVEEGMGRILDALAKSTQLDNTRVVFTGDNGYFYGEHGLDQERRLAYEESIRMPLLVRYPKMVKAGTRINEMTLNIDIAPTMLEACGATRPASLQGRSLVPLLKGGKPVWRRSFLVEYYTDRVMPRVRNMGYQAVRTDRWKYIRYKELKDMDELYDLRSDPFEMNNRIGDPKAAKMLAELKAELDILLKEPRP